MSRLSSIFDDTNDDGDIDFGEDVFASYKYLGAGRIVEEDYADADVKLSYLGLNGNVTGLGESKLGSRNWDAASIDKLGDSKTDTR